MAKTKPLSYQELHKTLTKVDAILEIENVFAEEKTIIEMRPDVLQLSNIIENKPIKSTFIKKLLRKVF